jgi:hypothetical protein
MKRFDTLRTLLTRAAEVAMHWCAVWRFRRVWIGRLGAQWPVAPIEAPQWTAADQESLLRFFRTEAGQKLEVLMRQMERDFNAGAVLKPAGCLQQACGYAGGFRAAFAYLVTLSAPLQPPTEESAPEAQNAGEASWRERLSP